MSISEHLVRRAHLFTSNLSRTVESLLSEFVDAEEAKPADVAAQLKQWGEASDAVVVKFGCPADEFSAD